MANPLVKLCLLVDGYKISIATATGVEESETVLYGDVVEFTLSTGERYLACLDVDEPVHVLHSDAEATDGEIGPMSEFWCYQVIPFDDANVETVEYDEDGNVVPELTPPALDEEKEEEKEKQNDETE